MKAMFMEFPLLSLFSSKLGPAAMISLLLN